MIQKKVSIKKPKLKIKNILIDKVMVRKINLIKKMNNKKTHDSEIRNNTKMYGDLPLDL